MSRLKKAGFDRLRLRLLNSDYFFRLSISQNLSTSQNRSLLLKPFYCTSSLSTVLQVFPPLKICLLLYLTSFPHLRIFLLLGIFSSKICKIISILLLTLKIFLLLEYISIFEFFISTFRQYAYCSVQIRITNLAYNA